MITRTIKETVNEFDSKGNLVKQTVTETTERDGQDCADQPRKGNFTYPSDPVSPSPWWGIYGPDVSTITIVGRGE